MKAFLVANVAVADQERFDTEYRPTRPDLSKFGGRVLVADCVPEPGEGEFPLDRVCVLEFDNTAGARAYLGSPEFAAAKSKRAGIASFRIILMHGTDEPRVSSPQPAYFLASTDLINPQGIERHLREWAPIGRGLMKRHGGHVIAQSSRNFVISTHPSSPPYPAHGGDSPEQVEGEWNLRRSHIHEYPDVEQARDFVTSREWVEGRRIRKACGDYRVVLLHGSSDPAESLL